MSLCTTRVDSFAPGSPCPDCNHTTLVHPMFGNRVKHCAICEILGSTAPTGGSLEQMWRATTERHIEMTAPKVAEYGSRDLVDIGREFLTLAGRDAADDHLAYEAGVFMYVRGKIARWAAAVGRGEPVSQDTLDDLIIYIILCLNDRTEENK